MAETIQIKRKLSTGAPSLGDLVDGELCLVVPDQKLYQRIDASTLLLVNDSGGGGGASSNSYMSGEDFYARSTVGDDNNWVGFGTFGKTSAQVSKGTGAIPLHVLNEMSLVDLPTGAVLQKIEITLSSSSADLVGCDVSISAIGGDRTVLPSTLSQTQILAPTALSLPVNVNDSFFNSISLNDYALTTPQSIVIAFRLESGDLTYKQYLVRTQIYYTLP